ncbi:hypothetical protein [Pseudomonas extremorientalis]|uniref:ApeA N-terminal domain-containing protein n=1 Tax=Pseudomonas extremorientalis TaxID=169669 RepID=A0A1H0P9E5_9PSED|nr:hypothetical protein [Pseudomonas extremorientalis]KAB0521810.1 hypothetical protein F7R08_01170 [Pseudomonas extremorientalis]OIN07857.1 hypothetical protein BFN10_16325 [Pseudomonas extremorientalis]SDP01591.1 hypothetical protein SAMN04490184_2053 [Pseudomonas extremorientalis]
MSFTEVVKNRIIELGFDCSVQESDVLVTREDGTVCIVGVSEEWEKSYRAYTAARSASYDSETRLLIVNNTVEMQVSRLASNGAYISESYTLKDKAQSTVVVGDCSMMYAIAFFLSGEYDKYFSIRVKRRLSLSQIKRRPVRQILFLPQTVTYSAKGRKILPELKSVSLRVIERALFKLAVEQNDCMVVWKPKKKRNRSVFWGDIIDDDSLSEADYDETVVNYYKLAKASPFPSQSFLAFYHVLEYQFLKVSELVVHDRLASILNEPKFRASRNNLDKVITAIRGHDSRNDETEMLRNVLARYISEEDLVEFLTDFEARCGEKIYTKSRVLFGQKDTVINKSHALANTAKVLKQVRNAIVHSTDRYKREDCHIPLTDSESIIEEYLPIVRFVAEKVIYGTAT